MVGNPLVSIVIPVFNRLELLKNTLSSVKSQTFTSFEVLIIDDASDLVFNINELQDILEGIPLSYYKLTKNGGPGKARSVGRGLAKGTYVAYLDSDDLWKPTFLEKTVSVLEKDKTVSIVFTNSLLNKANGSSSKRLTLDEGIYDFYDLFFKMKKNWATGAALWRSDISLSLNWYGFRDHEDYVHDILSLLPYPKIYCISEPLCVVNKNEALGIPRSNIEMFKSLILISKSEIVYHVMATSKRKVDFLSFILWRLSKRRYNKKEFLLFFKLYVSLIRWSDNFKKISITFMKLLKNKFN
ncbi:MAG: glycosyltransferase family 2 protein [Gelidibacter sp.]